MRRVMLAILLASAGGIVASCGTVQRYEYCDYGEKGVDERNKERGAKIGRNFPSKISGSSGLRKWRGDIK